MGDEDVRYRLSAEGLSEVVAAFKRVETEAKKSARGTEQGFAPFAKSLAGIRGLLAGVTSAVATVGLARMVTEAAATGESLLQLHDRFGTTVEDLSALKVALEQSGSSLAELTPQLTKLAADTAAASRDLGGEAADNFRRLGLSTKEIQNFAKQDISGRLETIGRALLKLPEGPQRTDAAIAALGVRGTKLLPILLEIGEKGFGGLRQNAERFSSLITEDMAKSLATLDSSFDNLKSTSIGLATQFASGLAPAITRSLRATQEELSAGQRGWLKFGEVVGGVLGALIGTITAFVDIAFTRLSNIAANGASAFKYYAAIVRGDLRAAETERSRIVARNLADSKNLEERLKKLHDGTFGDATPGPRSPLGPTPEEAAQALAEARAAEEASTKARLAAKRARIDADLALAKAGFKAEENEQERAFQSGLLSLATYYDRRRAIAVAGINAEIAALQRQRIMAAADKDKGLAEITKIDGRIRQLAIERGDQVAELNAKEAEQYEALAAERLDLEEKIFEARGDHHAVVMIQIQEEIRKADELLSKLGVSDAQKRAKLDELATALVTAKAADEAAAAAKREDDAFRDLAKDGIKEASDSLGELFATGINNAPTFTSVLVSMLTTVGVAVERFIGQLIALRVQTALLGLFGMGAKSAGSSGSALPLGVPDVFGTGMAEGGYVSGPGTGTSDSIPARLSAGEFVVRAAAVQQPNALGLLEALNGGLKNFHPISHTPRHYAAGGLVEAPGAGGGAGASLDATLGLEEGLVLKHLETAAGERALIRVIAKNRRSVSRALGVN